MFLTWVSGVVCRLFEGMNLHGPIKNPSGPMLLKLGTHKLYVVLSNIRDDDFTILIIYATLVSFYPGVLQISNVKSSKFP